MYIPLISKEEEDPFGQGLGEDFCSNSTVSSPHCMCQGVREPQLPTAACGTPRVCFDGDWGRLSSLETYRLHR